MLKVLIFMGACFVMSESHAIVEPKLKQEAESTQEIKIDRPSNNEDCVPENSAAIYPQPYNIDIDFLDSSDEDEESKKFENVLDTHAIAIKIAELIKQELGLTFRKLGYIFKKNDLESKCEQLVKNIRGKTKKEQFGLILKLICSLYVEIGDKHA